MFVRAEAFISPLADRSEAMPLAAPIVETTLSREIILQHAQALPAAPQVLGGLCELLQDANSSLAQISDQIRMDPTLSAHVLRLSNGVIFGSGATVGSIDEAVARVGFSEVIRVVGVVTVAGLVDRALGAYGIAADRMRESLLLHALASSAVAEAAGLDARSAYAGGLLRGVGMMVLDRAARGKLSAAEAFDPNRFGTYSDWEQARFGITNVDVTTLVLREWRFPRELVVGLDQHLLPGGSSLARVLNLAGAVALSRDLALEGEVAHWSGAAANLALLGLDERLWLETLARVNTDFERQRRALY